MDARSLEESVYLYIAHKVESLYRIFCFLGGVAPYIDTSVVLAFLHACSNNPRPVAALSSLTLKANCCFFQCLPPVYLQSEYTLTCMPTHLYTVAHAALLFVIA